MERLRDELVKAGAAGVTATVLEADRVPDQRRARPTRTRSSAARRREVEAHLRPRVRRRAAPTRFQMKPNIAVPAARRDGRPGDPDHRAPRQRARRRRADRRAAGRAAIRSSCSCPGVTDVGAREGDHPLDGAPRAEASSSRARQPTSEALLQANGARARRHGDRARRRRAARAGEPAVADLLPRAARCRSSPAATCATREADARREQPAGGQLLAEAATAPRSSAT